MQTGEPHLELMRQRLLEIGVADQPLILAVVAFDQLSKFGCYADEYIDLLLDVADHDATVVMNSFTWSFCESSVYHHRDSASEVGLASEVFRRMDGVKRSRHPIFSLIAHGPMADDVLAHPGPTCWGDGTPAEVLVEENAFCVSVGKEFPKSLTILHSFEEWVGVPYLQFRTFGGQVDFGDGPEHYETDFYVPTDAPINGLTYSWAPAVDILHDRTLVRGAKFDEPVRGVFAKDLQRAVVPLLESDPTIFIR